MSIVKEFNSYREKMNEKILGEDQKVLKRFFSLDHQAYDDGALPKKTKELCAYNTMACTHVCSPFSHLTSTLRCLIFFILI